MHVRIAGDPDLVAERFGKRLPKYDADILGRVVKIDVQIALGFELDIDQRMPGQLLEHVIQEAHARLDVVVARAVEIDRGGNFGFLGLARNRGLAFHGSSCPFGP